MHKSRQLSALEENSCEHFANLMKSFLKYSKIFSGALWMCVCASIPRRIIRLHSCDLLNARARSPLLLLLYYSPRISLEVHELLIKCITITFRGPLDWPEIEFDSRLFIGTRIDLRREEAARRRCGRPAPDASAKPDGKLSENGTERKRSSRRGENVSGEKVAKNEPRFRNGKST